MSRARDVSESYFPSGTKMLFQQTTAPTGWTKVTSSNDVALRVVSGTVGSGGSVAFETAFASQSISAHSGGAVSNHFLTKAQIPAHYHNIKCINVAGEPYNGAVAGGHSSGQWQTDAYTRTSPSSEMGGGSHDHGFTQPSDHSAINLSVKYVDTIIATKD